MLGSHLSISNSMAGALLEAEFLGLDTVQVFTKNQQQWKVKPFDESVVRDWHAELKRLGWQTRTVSHASYLINLASVQDELFAKSVDLMTVEIERCEQLSIPFLVHHPGSFVGWTLEQGMTHIADAYKELFKRTKGFKTVCCLEGTAGAGSHIGGDFAHLAWLREAIIDRTGEPKRIGFCLDTCHLHVAGYDMSTKAAAKAALDQFDKQCGVANLKVWHLNDSKGAHGSHLDRHEHVGLGQIGGNPPKHAKPAKAAKFSTSRLADSGFATIMQDPRFANIPKILETPKEPSPTTKVRGKAVPIPAAKRLDSINIKRLKSLCNL